jgi:hypothetical protein
VTVINGEFRRIKRKSRRKSSLDGNTIEPQVEYDFSGDVNQNTDTTKPLGVQWWEYTHQAELQTENVALTGHNNPTILNDNVFYRAENAVRDTVDTAAQTVGNIFKTGGSILIIGAILLIFLEARK